MLSRECFQGSFQVVLALLGGDEGGGRHGPEGGHAVGVVEGVGGGGGGEGVRVRVEGGGRGARREGGLAVGMHVCRVVVAGGIGEEYGVRVLGGRGQATPGGTVVVAAAAVRAARAATAAVQQGLELVELMLLMLLLPPLMF